MRHRVSQGWVAALAVGASLALAAPATAATFTVNSVGDTDPTPGDAICDVDPGAGEQCTLRAAINASNFAVGADTIRFAIPVGAVTIGLTADLPAVNDPVTIDGYTQGGAAPNTGAGFTAFDAIVNVTVDGNGFRTFLVTGGPATIRGLRIQDSGSDGIRLESSGNRVQGNYIGVDAAATSGEHNKGAGVAVFEGDNNVIGGTAAAERNVISGNGEPLGFDFSIPPYGVWVRGEADGTLVQGNLIGTDATGTAALPNGSSGVRVGGFTSGAEPVPTAAPNTIVGGTEAGAGNVISANGVAPAEAWGVQVAPAAGAGVKILGNRIGTDRTGTAALGNNPDGIELLTDEPVQVGDDSGHGNLISGNVASGLKLNSSGHTVQGNFIGTNAAGTAAIPNASQGIYANGNSNNTIGGTTVGARNVISGNGGDGIRLAEAAGSNTVSGNFIGTNAAGDAALPNGGAGIAAQGGAFNVIGGNGFPLDTPGGGNLISSNVGPGVALEPDENGYASRNAVKGNLIGTKADGTGSLGNGDEGVRIEGGRENFVGEPGNVIANNGGDGVAVIATDEGVATNNTISANSIFMNGGLGIDLLPDGVTANDDDDPDSGPNRLQNFPVITSVTPGASSTIAGTLNSTPGSDYLIELFESPTCDASGFGEGQKYLGSTSVTANAGGDATFSTSVPFNVPADNSFTATATRIEEGQVASRTTSAAILDLPSDTSEFSKCFGKAPENPQNPEDPQDPPITPQEPEEPEEPTRPACRDRTPPVSFLGRRNVRAGNGKLRIVGPSGLTVKGTAHDVRPCRSGVARVLVSLARVHGLTGVNCRFISDPNRYALTRPGNCRDPILFRVDGRKKWRFKFKAPLEEGLYRIRVRAFDRAGNKEKPAPRNGVFFKVH